jgi:hypothetical protein
MKPRIRSSDPFAALHTLTPVIPPVRDPVTSGPRPSAADRSVLEELHPGIAHAVTLLWGHPEMNDYFAKLWLADDRQTPIHPEAMSELMLLARVHEALAPARTEPERSIYGTAYTSYKRPQRDVWEQVAWRR